MRIILDTLAFLALCLMITGIVWQGLLEPPRETRRLLTLRRWSHEEQ